MMTGIIPGKEKRPRWFLLTGTLFLSAVILLFMRNFAGERVDPLNVEERAWLKAHPVIRFAPDPDFPPVEYFDKNGEYNGITKDYLTLIEKKLGIRLKIVRVRNWTELISKAKSRQVDMFAASKTPQRSEYLLFTRPYLELPAAIIVREKVKGPLTVEKLNGMKVSVVSEYAVHNFIAYNYPKLDLDVVPDVQTGLRKVSFGMSDAFVENLATATYYIEKEGITNLRIAGESGYVYRMAFCSRKDWPELNRILEKALSRINADEKQAIYKKWVPLEPRSLFASKKFQAGIIAAFAAVLLIIAGVIAWNRSLAKQVSRRTDELEKELSERKRAEESLRESEEKFRVLAETSPVAIIVYQGEKNVYVNPAAIQLIGYAEQDWLEMHFWDWAHEDFKEQVRYCGLARQQGEQVPPQYEFKCITKNGEEKWVVLSAGRIEYKGAPAGIVSIFDITDRKRMEDELQHARDELEKRVEERTAELAETVEALLLSRFCIDKAAIGIYQTTFEGDILSANDFACRSLGYTADELCALKVSDIDPAITGEKILEIKKMLDATGSATHETIHRRKDGTAFPVEITANNLEFQGKSYTFSFVKDITGRKRAEEALRESEARLKMSMDLAKLVQWEYDIKSRMFSFDDQFYALYGTTAEREGGTLMSADAYARKFVPAEESAIVAGGIAEVLANSCNQLEHRIIRADGEERFIVVRGEAVRDHAGCIVKIRGANQDITERKRMEEELRESKEKYQAIVDAIDGYIYIASRDYRIQFMNEGMSELFGHREQGEFCYRVLHGRDSVCPGCQSEAVFEGKTVRREWFNSRDGRWYYVTDTPIFHADGSISRQVLGTDITDRKLAEEQLRQKKQQLEALNNTLKTLVEEEVAKNREKDVILIQQNRQAALGEMLDHIAHQWKQPLNSISFIIQDLGETWASGELSVENVEEVVGNIMSLLTHMAQTIDVFRNFYRPEKKRTVFRLQDSIDSALSFMAPALRFHGIGVEIDADPELSAIGYPNEYSQVLLNILTNARDTFKERKVDKPVLRIEAFAESNKAVVAITDNAGGIPETIIGKIFDLYFTTRESKDGTGIGLYMSRNIIEKNMGGTLSASNVDGGAQFRIELNMPET